MAKQRAVFLIVVTLPDILACRTMKMATIAAGIIFGTWSALSGQQFHTEPLQEDRNVDFVEWIRRTEPSHSLDERMVAIGSLESIAVRQLIHFHDTSRRKLGDDWVNANIVPTLSKLLDFRTTEVRTRAASAFCGISREMQATKSALPRLIQLLRDPDDNVRSSAVSVFVFRGPDAEPAVLELTRIVKEDKDPYIREHAAMALRTTSIKSQHMLIDLLDEKDAKTRLAVAEALLGKYKGTDVQDELRKSVPKLKLLLHDENAELRRAAAEALRFQMADHNDCVTELTKALADKDANVRYAAAINVLELGEAAKPALDEILKVTSDENTLFCRQLTIALPRVGPATIPGLIKLLADKDANVRAYAADGLGKFGAAAKESVPALKGLLKDMGDVYELQGCVCNFAGRALAEITGDKSYLDHLPPLPKDGL